MRVILRETWKESEIHSHSKSHDSTELSFHGIQSIAATQPQLYGHAVVSVGQVREAAVQQHVSVGAAAVANVDLLPDTEVL